ncbi:class I SAM-dependent DNA methyltransferase [Hyphomicrobium sp. DY-1]|uniref:class I SAM-dependent DNA methyltransferase n=1 Tax=Hyphomicrobium sp. DY-1 TaxID=3075650 RepID=UPI0039C38F92
MGAGESIMPLSWNEIRSRAIALAHEFKDARREDGESQTFYNEFFNVFGISRRRVATFEEPVKKLGKKRGRIDLFWKGTLLVEQKSAGHDLVKAKEQAFDYFPHLKEEELPRHVLVSDFQTFELHDLDTGKVTKFKLKDLPKHVELFSFIAGYKQREFKDQDPVNIHASEIMGGLHDALKDNGYVGADLELFLVRLLFCLFADDTGIFEKDIFTDYIDQRTREDGTDLGPKLAELFQILNQEHDKRPKNLDEDLARFAYINGDLFRRPLTIASFDSKMRTALLDACYFEWDAISPAVFGALFQHVMDSEDKDKRRGIGAHYTTEKNILKVCGALFLDDLKQELEQTKDKAKLRALHDRIAGYQFLDPACGCGNFLIIAYREMRLLEIELLKKLYPDRDQLQLLDITKLSRIDVDKFYGIEIEEFPSRVAEVALWLVDHQMNMRLSEAFGFAYVRIPLKASPHIANADALKADWAGLVPPDKLSFILGNPPFIGHQYRSKQQVENQELIWGKKGRFGRLDFVSCWYRKALDYIRANPAIKVAFVSTNSLCQGEQASILWSYMFQQGVHIDFAHRTFEWASDARGKAAVHCVIVGFSLGQPQRRRLFEYDDIQGDPHEVEKVANINGYLIDGPDIALPTRTRPKPGYLQMLKGSQPTDGGHLVLNRDDRAALIAAEPGAAKWIKPYIGSEELLYAVERYCLWLKGIKPAELNALPMIKARVARVRASRLDSPTASVKANAATPTLFTQDRQPDEKYLVLPEVSSELRRYIPITFLSADTIASNKLQMIEGADLFLFGVLTSAMHMAWVRHICGRLKSDFSYAPSVYNNFPFPEPTDRQKQDIASAANALLETRATFKDATLAELYDPLGMPPALTKAHAALDRAVDKAYRSQPFANDRVRMEFLFKLFQETVLPLIPAPKLGGRAKKKASA